MRYNAQLSSPKRPGSPSALRRKHKTRRKPKVPRVEGLLELFVIYTFDANGNLKPFDYGLGRIPNPGVGLK